MRKHLIKLSVISLIILCVAAVFFLSTNRVEAAGNVIYIADVAKGTGDGSSAENAMGNSEAYNAAISASSPPSSNTIYQGSALYQAFNQLASTGGTVVVCDALTVKIGDNTTAFGQSLNFTLPATSGTITVTSVYDGVDYRAAANAKFNYSTEQYLLRIRFSGKTIWENLDILRTYVTGRTTASFVCGGKDTVFGDGLNVTQLRTNDSTVTTDTLVYPDIYGGNMWNHTNSNVNVTINSGTWNRLCSVSFANAGAGDINGNAEYTINGGTFKGIIAATTHNTSVGVNYCRITGNYTLNINGGSVQGIYTTTPYDSRNYTTNPSTYAGFGSVEGDVTVNITGGTIAQTIYLTAPGHKYRKDTTETASTASLNVTNGYGQIGGNATVNISGNPTFVRVDLGAQAFKITSTSSVYTLKMNGDQWKATSATLDTFAFAGGGSNFASLAGYKYAIIDFSGMTYDQYWNKKMNNASQNIINHAYYLFSGVTATPTFAPEGVTTYGSREKEVYGFNEVVEPINALASIEITTPPTKTEYAAGQPFESAGMVVQATYESGHTVEITEYECTPAGALSLGDTYVTISYTLGGITKTTTQSITVIYVALSNIEITALPDKIVYKYGETFDSTGLEVTATFADLTTANIVVGDLDGLPSSALTTLGTNTITVSYTISGVTKTDEFDITVNDYITVINGVAGTYDDEIKIGEAFDSSSIKVNCTTASGDSFEVENALLTVSGNNSPYEYSSAELFPGYAVVTISYVDEAMNPNSVTAKIQVNIISDIEVEGGKIYISDTGTGDGKTDANPLGPASNYPASVSAVGGVLVDQDANNLTGTSYQGSAIFRAMYALKNSGGEIIIVGDTSFAYAGNNVTDTTITHNGSANFRAPANGNNLITITNKDGITYGAKLIYNSIFNNPRIHFRGQVDIDCDEILICHANSSTPYIAFNGYTSSINTLSVTQLQYTLSGGVISGTPVGATSSSRYPMVIAGEIWGQGIIGGTNLSVTGGTWYQGYSAAQFGGTGILSLVTGDANLNLTDTTFKGTIYGMSTAITSGGETLNTCRVDGNVTITINGGNYSMIMFGKNGFATEGKTFTIKLNSFDSFVSPFAYTLWGNGGSAFLAGAIKGTRVLDFSGMSYNDYWNSDVTVNKTTATTFNSSYCMVNAAARQGMYGVTGTNADSGFEQVIGPTPLLDSIEVTTTPTKKVYLAGESIDYSGLVFASKYQGDIGNETGLTAGFAYDNTVKAEAVSLLNENSKQAISISYTDDGVTKTATFDITVRATDYVGSSIRLSGNEGLRFKVQLANALRKANLTNDGIVVKEYGMLVARSAYFQNSGTMTMDLNNVYDVSANPTGKAIKVACLSRPDLENGATWSDKYFDTSAVANDPTTLAVNYTVVIIDSASGSVDGFKSTSFTFRDYVIVTDGTTDYVIYGNYSSYTDTSGTQVDADNGLGRSVEYVANQVTQAEFDLKLPPYDKKANQERINALRTAPALVVTVSDEPILKIVDDKWTEQWY